MNAICHLYGRFHDTRSGVHFDSTLIGGLYVGLAKDLTEEQLERLYCRDGFEILDDAALAERLSAGAPPISDPTGDPIADSATLEAIDKMSYQEQLRLAKARGIKFDKQPSKGELLAALTADPLGDAPAPPGG